MATYQWFVPAGSWTWASLAGSSPPGSGDTVDITNNDYTRFTVDITSPVSIAALTLSASQGQLLLDANLTVSGLVDLDDGVLVLNSAVTLDAMGGIELGGMFDSDPGGSIQVAAGANAQIDGDMSGQNGVTVDGGSLTFNGNVTGGGFTFDGAGGSVTLNGSVSTGATFATGASGGVLHLAQPGSFTGIVAAEGSGTLDLSAAPSAFAGTLGLYDVGGFTAALELEGVSATSYSLSMTSGSSSGVLTLNEAGGGTLSIPIYLSDGDLAVTFGAGYTQLTLVAAPRLSGATTVAYLDNSPPVAVDPSLAITFSGTSPILSAQVSFQDGFLAGDQLGFTSQNGIVGSYDAQTGVLTLTGAASAADYQAALRSVTFSTSAADPTAGGTDLSRVIRFAVTDDQSTSSYFGSTVDVTPPFLSTPGNPAAYAPGGAAVAVAPAVTVNDTESQTLASATVAIVGGFLAGDQLDFTNQNGITGSYDAATGVLTLTGPASLGDYQAALQSVTFSSSAADPTNGGVDLSREVALSVNDGLQGSVVVDSTVSLAPTLLLVDPGTAQPFWPGSAPTTVAPTLTITDTESSTLASATVAITGGVLAGDQLDFTNQNGITGSYDAATGVLTLTGSASLADYQAALRSIGFSSTAADPTVGGTDDSRTITISASDGTVPSDPVTQSLGVEIKATYTLTTGVDTINGGLSVNTIIAPTGTLNPGDQINGGSSGQNVLELEGGGTFDLSQPATLTGISTVDVQEGLFGSTSQTVDMRNGLNVTVDVGLAPGGSATGAMATIIGANDSDTFNLGAGEDIVTLGSASETVMGGGGTDLVYATSATDQALIHGGPGSMTLQLMGGGNVGMNGADTGIDTVNLLSSASAYDFTADGEAGLVIADHNTGADTITVGAASQQVWTWTGSDTVIETASTAADIWAHPGSMTMLEFEGGGAVAMNRNDTGLAGVVLEAAGSAYTFTANNEAGLVITDDSTGADTLTAGGAHQTFVAGSGGDTFVLAAAGHDVVMGDTASLNGDTIWNFGAAAGNIIDVTDLDESGLPPTAVFRENAQGTGGVLTLSSSENVAMITLMGQFAAAGFSGTAAAAGFLVTSEGAFGAQVLWAPPHG